MLRHMSPQQLFEWEAYSQLEPFGSPFQDMLNGQIVQTLFNIYRDRKKYPQPFKLQDFLLLSRMVDSTETTKVPNKKAPWQAMKKIAEAITMAHNKPKPAKREPRK
jgi:hypothetical protein